MANVDYQAIIRDALQDTTGNGFRAEANARFAMAILFHEAVRARTEAKRGGFPIHLTTDAETFYLSTVTINALIPLGPRIRFQRVGVRIVGGAYDMPRSLSGIDAGTRELNLGVSDSDAVKRAAQDIIGWAVGVLAQQVSTS